MAIDGMAPLLVFHIFNAGYHAKSLSKWLKFAVDDERQNTTAKGIGLTIPLYLSERLTKVAWQSHNMSISIGDITNGDKSYQRKIDNSVDIDLVFNRESLFLQLMMPLFSLCWQRLETNDYRISYYNRDIIIYKGRLTSLQQSSESNTSLSKLSINLAKSENEETEAPEKVPVISMMTPPST